MDAKVDALGVLEILVREPVDSDFTEWRVLWDEYLTFYKTARSEPQIVSLWHRLLDPEDPVECLVAEVDGHVVGITHYLPHADTWDERPICYLSDLYVHSSTRGEGIATLLMMKPLAPPVILPKTTNKPGSFTTRSPVAPAASSSTNSI